MRKLILFLLLSFAIPACNDGPRWATREEATHAECSTACLRLETCNAPGFASEEACNKECETAVFLAIEANGASKTDAPIGSDEEIEACLNAMENRSCDRGDGIPICYGLLY